MLSGHHPNEELSADYTDMIYAGTKQAIVAKRKAFIRKWRLKCARWPIVWRRPATSCSPSRGSRKANGNRSAPRMRSNACTRNSSDGSRRKPSCRARKPPPCCSGHCWLRDRSPCEKSTAGKASLKSLPIKSLTSPHDRVISSRRRSRQNQFQHKSRRHHGDFRNLRHVGPKAEDNRNPHTTHGLRSPAYPHRKVRNGDQFHAPEHE